MDGYGSTPQGGVKGDISVNIDESDEEKDRRQSSEEACQASKTPVAEENAESPVPFVEASEERRMENTSLPKSNPFRRRPRARVATARNRDTVHSTKRDINDDSNVSGDLLRESALEHSPEGIYLKSQSVSPPGGRSRLDCHEDSTSGNNRRNGHASRSRASRDIGPVYSARCSSCSSPLSDEDQRVDLRILFRYPIPGQDSYAYRLDALVCLLLIGTYHLFTAIFLLFDIGFYHSSFTKPDNVDTFTFNICFIPYILISYSLMYIFGPLLLHKYFYSPNFIIFWALFISRFCAAAPVAILYKGSGMFYLDLTAFATLFIIGASFALATYLLWPFRQRKWKFFPIVIEISSFHISSIGTSWVVGGAAFVYSILSNAILLLHLRLAYTWTGILHCPTSPKRKYELKHWAFALAVVAISSVPLVYILVT